MLKWGEHQQHGDNEGGKTAHCHLTIARLNQCNRNNHCNRNRIQKLSNWLSGCGCDLLPQNKTAQLIGTPGKSHRFVLLTTKHLDHLPRSDGLINCLH